MISVTLTAEEVKFAEDVANRIDQAAPRIMAKTMPLMSESSHTYSCKAKLAFHKLLGKEWNPIVVTSMDEPATRTVSEMFGCRLHTTNKDYGNTLVRPAHEDEVFVITAITEDKTVRFLRYIKALDAKKAEFWAPHLPLPAWLVPARHTKPIEELVASLRETHHETQRN